MCIRDRGKTHGPWVIHRKDGSLLMRGSFDMDQRQGPWTFFWENGQVRQRGSFNGEERTGLWETFEEDGSLMLRGHYVDGEKDGEWFERGETIVYPLPVEEDDPAVDDLTTEVDPATS